MVDAHLGLRHAGRKVLLQLHGAREIDLQRGGDALQFGRDAGLTSLEPAVRTALEQPPAH